MGSACRHSRRPKVRESPVAALVLRKQGLHQLDDLAVRCDRIGNVLCLIVDNQIQAAGKTIGSHAGDVEALTPAFQNEGFGAGKLGGPYGLRFLLQFF